MSEDRKRNAWTGDASGGNYTAKVEALAAKLGVGVNEIDIAHDDHCALLTRGLPCNCDPDVSVRRAAPPESLTPEAAPDVSSAMKALAAQIARKLKAQPARDPPARAVFDGGVIYLNATEIAIVFTDLGCLFVKDVGGRTLIEGVVTKELERAEKRLRHRKLQKWSKKIFGDDMQIHDPMGYAGGPKSPMS